ncbi:MAG TPA: hypothetical protein VGH23_16370 [Rhizomicrobium sp.]|jgi:hypothetical protein
MRDIGAGFLALILFFVLGTGLAIWGLFFNRHAAPYAEETRRLTYGQSLAYQQGSQRDFENLCLQYVQATDGGAKAIIRDTILRRKQDYTGPDLGPDVQACFSKLGL